MKDHWKIFLTNDTSIDDARVGFIEDNEDLFKAKTSKNGTVLFMFPKSSVNYCEWIGAWV